MSPGDKDYFYRFLCVLLLVNAAESVVGALPVPNLEREWHK